MSEALKELEKKSPTDVNFFDVSYSAEKRTVCVTMQIDEALWLINAGIKMCDAPARGAQYNTTTRRRKLMLLIRAAVFALF